MPTTLPTPVPQIPVRDLAAAIAFYQTKLGFSLDWKHENAIAGVSRDKARLFLNCATEEDLHPIRIWLNLDSVEEVDGLYHEWREAGVKIVEAPEQKPWGLYEFTVEDCTGNTYRVFYDTTTPRSSGRG